MAEIEEPKDKLEELYQQAKAYFELPESVRNFIKTDALEYATTRRRQLKAAILEGDEEQRDSILNEYAAIVGKENSQFVYLRILEQLMSDLDKND